MGFCPDAVKRLVDRFAQQSDRVRSPDYDEALVRADFVNPLVAALGWAVDNRSGVAGPCREVVREGRVPAAGRAEAPAYAFRIGGVRAFFLAAERPAVDIRDDGEPAYRLRRYAWSAKLACSLLTNVEGLAVYDARVRPKPLDKASVARREYLRYTEYETRWDFLTGTFSRDAVLAGAFDRYCASAKGRGGPGFDDAFLGEIEAWCHALATSLARHIEGLDGQALTVAVRRIIDRILFLRVAEDRGIEPAGQLRAALDGPGAYRRLVDLFDRADGRYHSAPSRSAEATGGDEPPDTLNRDTHARDAVVADALARSLDVDDATLRRIADGLYYPQSPFELSVVSGDLLGDVYERLLGKVVTLAADRTVSVEDKPEVRKAGGVYYTPAPVVDHVVRHTLGPLLDGRTPREAAKLKVLDPACGSGAFLIGTYQFLLDWYHTQYTARRTAGGATPPPAALAAGRKPVLRSSPDGGWSLTLAERKRILLDHVHGVDLDAQAVEVTKLTLLLKCLEGEAGDAAGSGQLAPFHGERAPTDLGLPDLSRNIVCGNSLVGTDVVGTEAWAAMADADRRRLKPFDPERAFPAVFARGGFDAVVGNPPWGQKDIGKDDRLADYLRARFPSARGIFDLFRPFVELAVRLARPGGVVGQVLPDIVLLKDYESTRELLLGRTTLVKIDWWGMAFADAVIDAATIVARKGSPPAGHRVEATIRPGGSTATGFVATIAPATATTASIRQSDFARNPRSTFNLILTDDRRAVVEKLDGLPRLGTYFEVHEGVHSGNVRAELFVDRAVDDSCRELLFGRGEIAPYLLRWDGKFIRLAAVPERKSAARYANVGRPAWHERPKLLVRRTGDHVLAAVDPVGRYCSNNFFLVFPRADHPLDLYGLCALLNSRAVTAYFRLVEPRRGRVFAELKIKHLGQFPIPPAADARGAETLNRLGRGRAELALRAAGAALPDDAARLAHLQGTCRARPLRSRDREGAERSDGPVLATGAAIASTAGPKGWPLDLATLTAPLRHGRGSLKASPDTALGRELAREAAAVDRLIDQAASDVLGLSNRDWELLQDLVNPAESPQRVASNEPAAGGRAPASSPP
jgi:hypothetical protein